jgi:hypothetical protein
MAELLTVSGGLIECIDAYMDNLDLAQQLKLLRPPAGPRSGRRVVPRTKNQQAVHPDN